MFLRPENDDDEDRDYKQEYRDRQRELREAGFTPYNCDEVDEFPHW